MRSGGFDRATPFVHKQKSAFLTGCSEEAGNSDGMVRLRIQIVRPVLRWKSMSGRRTPSVPRWLRIMHVIAASTRNRWKYRLGRIDSFSGSSLTAVPVDQSVAYINRVYDEFVCYGKLQPQDIEDKTVVEIGPGDNAGVLLRFLAAGARRAWAADKYYSKHDIEHERRIYQTLRAGLSAAERERFDTAVLLEPKLQFQPDRLQYFYGKEAREIDQVIPAGSVDLVISRVALQEVGEIDGAFQAMDRVLRAGGRMIHKIDLRDDGMFSSCGFHPREFLTISERVYHWMADETNRPNRRMLNYYRQKMRSLAYDAEFYITGIIEDGGYRGLSRKLFHIR